MQYYKFVKELENAKDEINYAIQQIEWFQNRSGICVEGLSVLNQHKGDDPVQGHFHIIKPLIKELQIQLNAMRMDFCLEDIQKLPRFHFNSPLKDCVNFYSAPLNLREEKI